MAGAGLAWPTSGQFPRVGVNRVDGTLTAATPTQPADVPSPPRHSPRRRPPSPQRPYPHLRAGRTARLLSDLAVRSPRSRPTGSCAACSARSTRGGSRRPCGKLAAFGTRHTLSARTTRSGASAPRGTGSSTQLQRYAAASGGRMTVELQSFIQPVSPRDPDADPDHQRRRHAARRHHAGPRLRGVRRTTTRAVTDVMDVTSDAPGADDDASGVAVSMELARVLADPPHRGDARVRRGRRRGAGPLRLRPPGPARSRRPAPTCRPCSPTTSSAAARADDGTRDPRTVRLFAEGVPTAETPAQAAIRQSIGGENDSPSAAAGPVRRQRRGQRRAPA